jgi:putative transposase
MHRVRLYPSRSQVERLTFCLDVTRQLYNAMLEQRRDAFRRRGITVTGKMQYAELTDLRACDARVRAVYRESEDAVLHRLDLAFAAFFSRLKRGETPGYPRFRSHSRWKQLEYPHGNRALKILGNDQNRVMIPGIGSVRMRKGCGIPAFGRAFIIEKNGRWYAVFESQREAEPLSHNDELVGVDLGVTDLVVLSTGETIPNSRHTDRLRSLVERHAIALEAATERDSRKRVTNRADRQRRKAVLRLARAKEREANARRDTLHKVSHDLVQRFGAIAIEKLRVGNMTRSAAGTVEEPGKNVAAKSGLNRRILDAGFGMFKTLICGKAEYAGRRVVFVDARFTSQTCSWCGHVAAESRQGKRFRCIQCGVECDADVNAARVIRQRAQSAPKSERIPGAKPGGRKAA